MTSQADMEGEKLRKGPWLEEEDEQLTAYVNLTGDRRRDALVKESGLRRSGNSRWNLPMYIKRRASKVFSFRKVIQVLKNSTTLMKTITYQLRIYVEPRRP